MIDDTFTVKLALINVYSLPIVWEGRVFLLFLFILFIYLSTGYDNVLPDFQKG